VTCAFSNRPAPRLENRGAKAAAAVLEQAAPSGTESGFAGMKEGEAAPRGA